MQADQALECDPGAWQRTWRDAEGGGEVLELGNVELRGRPGLVTLHLADGAGAGGASALAPDTLELNLAAGPMAVRPTTYAAPLVLDSIS